MFLNVHCIKGGDQVLRTITEINMLNRRKEIELILQVHFKLSEAFLHIQGEHTAGLRQKFLREEGRF